MDSGNSGSIQSSSGGDEEYDSRAESISSFLNSNISHTTNPPPPPPSHHHHHHHSHNSSMFDPLSNYFDPLSSRPSILDTVPVWSKTLRSDSNCTQINNPIFPSPPSVQPFFGSSSSSPTVHFPPVAENTVTITATPPRASSSLATNNNDQLQIQNQTHHHVPVRNPKKRSRASRRAPTTVLTTDTANFRAMVQEFTGIPAPPFTSSPFSRTRLDFFGTPSTIRSNPLDASSQQQTPYLLRPFAQKFQPPPFLSSSSSSSSSFLSSSMVDGTSTNNINSGTSTTTSLSNSTSVNYNQGLLNMQNPILTFQSLLQSSAPKFPLSNQTILGSKPSLEIPSNDSHLKMGVLDDFGLTHGHVNHTHLTGLPNLVSSDRTASRTTDNNPASWADGVGSGSTNTDQSHLRSVNGNYEFLQSVANGKLHYSGSASSNFHSEKGSENVSTRGEGMMESWICSSD
ncbi:hypothetical protein ACSBR1_009283 [Camellia fascicularis]